MKSRYDSVFDGINPRAAAAKQARETQEAVRLAGARVRDRKELPSRERIAAMVCDLDWYALRVVSGKEFVTREILFQRGVTAYCPTVIRRQRRSAFDKNLFQVEYPAVHGYLFAGFVPGLPAWFDLFQVSSIRSCVGVDGRPVKIYPQAMRQLLVAFDGVKRPKDQRSVETMRKWKKGEIARICDGAFAGMTVPVESVGTKSVQVVVELFGGCQSVSVPIWQLEAA